MDSKVMPSRKTPIPAGDDRFPQHTAPNPSQTNGMNPPKIPPIQRDNGMSGQGNGPGAYMPQKK